jgi:hypothetical protein
MGREANLQRAITDRLNQTSRCWWIKTHQAGRGRRGIPDLLVCYRGTFLAIELKTDTGKLRPEQTLELHQAQAAGAIAIVARNWSDIELWMRRIDRDASFSHDRRTNGERTAARAPRIWPTIIDLDAA